MLTEEDIEKIAEKVLRKLVVNGAEYAPLAHMHAATQMMADDVLWYHKVGDNFDRTAYGYQWWIIDAGPHTYYLAWGHGGQQIAVLPELDMVIVVTADPLDGEFGGNAGALENANLNLVADFIAELPPA